MCIVWRCLPPLPFIHIKVSITVSASVFARIVLRRNCVFCEYDRVIVIVIVVIVLAVIAVVIIVERAACDGIAAQGLAI